MYDRCILFIILLLLCSSSGVGVAISQAQEDSPTITLPWGTWKATSYDSNGDYYTFQNVRFGKKPVGSLRFAASVYPDPISDPETIQDSSYGYSCIQFSPSDAETPRLGLGPGTPYIGEPVNQAEDCLFLDIYVPKSAFASGAAANIPVVVWIYGGAYVFGAKDFKSILYNGTGFLRQAAKKQKQMIYVVGNYRLGAFGWLAGSYMEKAATPNAGLTDQRLVLQFVQDYIHLVGGDKTQVSAWGESAGAGSIIHHLILKSGQLDPLFKKAFVMSPAFQWAWDRPGILNSTYTQFANLVGCQTGDIHCLRTAPIEKLCTANKQLIEPAAKVGNYLFGPAVDGRLINNLSPVELSNQNYWKGLDSIIISHVIHESDSFVPNTIKTETDFVRTLQTIFPGTDIPTIVNQTPFYDASRFGGDQLARMIAVAQDAFFTSNTRELYNAYKTKAYAVQYGWPVYLYSRHAYDLMTVFWNSDVDFKALLAEFGLKLPDWVVALMSKVYATFSPDYQQYLVSYAITGDPNKFQEQGYQWGFATDDGDYMTNVMGASWGILSYFTTVKDEYNRALYTEFWVGLAKHLTGGAAREDGAARLSEQKIDVVIKDEV